MMRVTVVTLDAQVFSLEVRQNERVQNLKLLVQMKATQFDLYKNGVLMNESSNLDVYGVKQYDMVMIGPRQANQPAPPQPTSQAQSQPPVQNQNDAGNVGVLRNILSRVTQRTQAQQQQPQRRSATDPEVFRSYVMSNPDLLNQLLHNDRELAEAVLAEDNILLAGLLEHRERAQQEKQRREYEAIERLNSNPFDVEAQKIIEEKIRRENVAENMEMAIEYSPESFGRVYMLYIPVEVNGTPLQAFVDSGAQQTIMSVECARRCGIMRLVDTSFAGMATGVGSAPIVGRVHLAQVKIGGTFFACSFTILDSKKGSLEFLLGLDMLKRHQCCIDLKSGTLNIGPESILFLSEGEILEKESLVDEEDKEKMLESQKRVMPGSVSVQEHEKKEKEEDAAARNNTPAHVAETRFSEDVVKQIMELGFPRLAVIEALTVTDGNPDMAVSYLTGN